MSVKTVQAQVKQITSQISWVLRQARDRKTGEEEAQELIEKLHRMEKELYTVWKQEKHRRWANWVRKLNNLDHSKATRAFYAELKTKKTEQEQPGPIVNEEGELSTSLKECMENWRSFY